MKIGFSILKAGEKHKGYLGEFTEGQDVVWAVVYDLDALESGEEANFDEFCETYEIDSDIAFESTEWIFEGNELTKENEFRDYFLSLGFLETTELIERFEELPL